MASSQTKLNPNNFDPELLTLDDPMENKERKGVYSARLRYDGQPFLLEIPKLFAPFGASSFNDDGKYNLVLAVGKDSKEEEFKIMLRQMEKRISTLVSKVRMKKLQKKKFQSIVKEPNDEKYDDRITIKLKCNSDTGELFAKVYNKGTNESTGRLEFNEVKVNLQNITREIPKRSKIRGVLMMGMWFVNDKCGVTINAKQLVVYPNKDQACLFDVNEVSDSEEGGNEEEEVVESEEEN